MIEQNKKIEETNYTKSELVNNYNKNIITFDLCQSFSREMF